MIMTTHKQPSRPTCLLPENGHLFSSSYSALVRLERFICQSLVLLEADASSIAIR
jgi:hypothetical protein